MRELAVNFALHDSLPPWIVPLPVPELYRSRDKYFCVVFYAGYFHYDFEISYANCCNVVEEFVDWIEACLVQVIKSRDSTYYRNRNSY